MAGATAFIADIHGNIWALDAVLADIQRRGIQAIFNLGDSVYGPLEPALTASRLMEAAVPSVRGNQDRILLDPPGGLVHPTLLYTMKCLESAHFGWLLGQPSSIESGRFFMCHGTPMADDVYLTEAVNASAVWLRRSMELERLIEGVESPIVLCGHSHIPRIVQLTAGKVIVNPGSVGLPAYSDELPFPHRMETGSPHARYAILDDGRLELIAVPYDYRPAVAKAHENGREDWAIALETGFAV